MSWGFQMNASHVSQGLHVGDGRSQFEASLQHNFNNLMICGSKAGLNYRNNKGIGGYDRHLPHETLADASSDATLAELVCSAPPGYQLDPPLQLSLHQLQMLGSSVLGWQVLVESAEGNYVGHVCWMLDHCSRLGLEQVSRPGSDVRRVGLLLLYYRHIHSVTLLGRRPHDPQRTRQQKSNVLEERTGRSLLMKKIVPPHLLEKRRDELDEEEEDDEGAPLLPPPPGCLQRPNDWRVIDILDDSYRQAVSSIGLCRRVGLSCVGQRVGRWGVLAWLCIATPDKVYLFDAATLGLHATLWGQQEKRSKNKTMEGVLSNNGVEDREQVRSSEKEAETDCGIGKEALEPTAVDVHSPAGNDDTKLNPKEMKCDGVDLSGSLLSSNEPKEGDAADLAAFDLNSSPGERSGSANDRDDPERATGQRQKEELQERTKKSTLLLSQENSIVATDWEAAQPVSSSCSLADVLQNGAVQVVMHDARCLCDLLQHQAGVAVASLYDTQATEVYLHLLQYRGDCPAFVPSLGALLNRRLGLSPQHLLFDKVHRRHGGDSSVYFERPLPSAIMAGLASSAMFLCELRHLQLFELLADLRQLTAVHASSYALRDDNTRTRVEQHMVPDSVQQLGRRTVLNCLPPAAGTKTAAWGRHRLSPAY